MVAYMGRSFGTGTGAWAMSPTPGLLLRSLLESSLFCCLFSGNGLWLKIFIQQSTNEVAHPARFLVEEARPHAANLMVFFNGERSEKRQRWSGEPLQSARSRLKPVTNQSICTLRSLCKLPTTKVFCY